MTLWVDGSLVDEDAAVIRANDHGLVVGDGVFETCKVVDGEVFALSRHLRRLRTSATGLGLRYDEAAVRSGVAAVTAGSTGYSRLRITLTGGPAPYGSGRGDAAPSLLVASVPWHGWDATASVAVVPWTRNERSATAGIEDDVVRRERRRAAPGRHELGASEAIFANTRGELCEGTGSNVFVGIGGRLVTPPLDSGCLPGITRELILEWLGDIEERALPVSALAGADEAFLASSTRDVQPIRLVDGRAAAGRSRSAHHPRHRGLRDQEQGDGPMTVVVTPAAAASGDRRRRRAHDDEVVGSPRRRWPRWQRRGHMSSPWRPPSSPPTASRPGSVRWPPPTSRSTGVPTCSGRWSGRTRPAAAPRSNARWSGRCSCCGCTRWPPGAPALGPLIGAGDGRAAQRRAHAGRPGVRLAGMQRRPGAAGGLRAGVDGRGPGARSLPARW